MIVCPDCKGKKQMMAFVDGQDFNGVAEIACLRCRGSGEVCEDTERWMKIGGIHRTWRVAQWESLAECANRLGMGAAELSAMEQGRKDPTRLIADIPLELQPRI
ncbi:hypothetical protein [Bradyrhizobium sp. SZCCHNRI1073]|uniref:hypothetical protein n=1 Tax=Bradyrhizobium sp. SZCCHNRI1073 TaxID=3057280 RepID=UPI0029160A2D|nr:hypothetical protein [Bradyrhizobium sp. SZCCHNRI1073]